MIPVNASAMISRAAFQANLQLSTISAQQAQAIAQVQSSFEQEDYEAALSANDDYQKTLEATQTTLENLSTQIESSIESARTYNLNAQNQIFTQQMNSAQLSLTQKNDLFQNYISSGQLSLAQQTQAEKYWNDQQTQAIAKLNVGVSEGELAVQEEQANIANETFQATFGTGALGTLASGSPNGTTSGTNAPAGGQSGTTTPPPLNSDGSAPAAGYKYNASTGQFTDGAGNPITGDALSVLKSNLNTAGVHTYDDGLAYLDTSGYSNQNMATGAQNAARANGILPLAPADASIVNNLEAAKSQLATMQQYFNQTGAPSNDLEVPFTSAIQGASGAFGGQEGQAIASYNSAKASLYDILSSLSESKRANGGEFEVGLVSVPNVGSGIPTISANGNAQFAALNNQMNSLIASIVPGFMPQSNPANMSASDIANALAGNTSGSSSQPLTGQSFFNAANTPTQ